MLRIDQGLDFEVTRLTQKCGGLVPWVSELGTDQTDCL